MCLSHQRREREGGRRGGKEEGEEGREGEDGESEGAVVLSCKPFSSLFIPFGEREGEGERKEGRRGGREWLYLPVNHSAVCFSHQGRGKEGGRERGREV